MLLPYYVPPTVILSLICEEYRKEERLSQTKAELEQNEDDYDESSDYDEDDADDDGVFADATDYIDDDNEGYSF